MFRPFPISLLQFSLFWLVVAIGAVALFGAFRGSSERGPAAKRSWTSTAGIALEALGFGATGLGRVHAVLAWWAPASLVSSLLVLLLGGSAIALFVAATRAMGKNWSVVARMRSDHQLVRSGPFAVVRHPIYLALFLYLLSFAVAFGHIANLLVAIPFFCIGTFIRIREEEKLLRAQFGEDHARYVREVPPFIPFFR